MIICLLFITGFVNDAHKVFIAGKLLFFVYRVFVRFTKKLRADDVDVDVDVDDVDVDDVDGGIMIFTSSHSESIKILEFLRSERASVYLVGDEDAELDFSSARRQFSERKIKIMLYTEKSHFDNRYQIDGVNYLIMYSLPERKEFYFEVGV
ncbi:putative digestive organ expansion factor, predicted [Medicago truncatula]|uniref:Putative digestive organ expansion factor, predicted n=1 Tax=Medicago truncatula TaxID=3880 RepID=A0A396GPJ3_MEDTR|nr:putative digestive organ expansion factor, predicted [Medicago truncatula]